MNKPEVKEYRSFDYRANRLANLAAVLTKTDRVLTGDPKVFVKFRQNSSAAGVQTPAYTIKSEISIVETYLNDLGSKRTLIAILGLNYHELSHVMFTPKAGEAFVDRIKVRRLFRYYNMLEDQRIETLFTAMYRPATVYFTEMIARFLLANPDQYEHSLPLIHGRRYLPLELRQLVEKSWTQGNVDPIKEIIDEYRLLDLSTVDNDLTIQNRAFELVEKFKDLLVNSQAENPMECKQDDDDGDVANQSESDERNPDPNAQREAKKKAEKQTKEQDEKEKEEGEDGSGFWDDTEPEDEESEDDSEGEGEDDEYGEGDDEDGSGSGEDSETDDDDSDYSDSDGSDEAADGEDDAEDGSGSADDSEIGDDGEQTAGDSGGEDRSGEDSDSDSDESAGDGAGTEESEPPLSQSELEDEIENVLNDILDAVDGATQVNNEVRNTRKSMMDPTPQLSPYVEKGTETPIDPEMGGTIRKLEREFSRLRARLEPNWKYGSDNGRLNVGRAMFSSDLDDIFDEWEEGNEESAGLELIIDLDVSGSMINTVHDSSGNLSSRIEEACKAAYVIHRGVAELDANVTVLGFGEYVHTLHRRTDSLKKGSYPIYKADDGSTMPETSLQLARRIFAESPKPNKLFVAITDGQWGGFREFEEKWETLLDFDAYKVFIEIGGASYAKIGKYNESQFIQYFNVAVESSGSGESLAKIMKTAVDALLKKNVHF